MALTAFPLHATTVKWLTKPEYDAISYYNKDIFKCKKDGKYQLIDFTGKKLLSVPADSITDFCDGYALALDFIDEKDHNKKTDGFLSMKIKGILSERGYRYVEVDGNFRTIFYSYFSEGMLVVANTKDGKLGYLDTEGDIIIPCKYQKARPFIMGWASVVPDNKKSTPKYIDVNENPLIVFFNEGKLSAASSFNENGEALVISDKGDMAVINTRGEKTPRSIRNVNPSKLIREHDYAYCENNEEYIPPHNEMPVFRKDIFPYSSGLSSGYLMTGNDTLLMPQFTYAGAFADDCAIVALNNKYGIITLVDGTFSSYVDNMSITFKEANAQEINYILNIPEGIDAKQLEIDFDNGEGELNGMDMSAGEFRQTGINEFTHTFTPQVEKTQQSCTIRTEVKSESLLLWQDTKKLSVQNSSVSTPVGVEAFFTKVNEKADAYDNLTVNLKVNNNTDEPVDVIVTFSIPELHYGNQIVSEKRFEVRLEAHQKNKMFPITFKVVKQEKVSIKVTVNTINKNGEQKTLTKYKKVTLNPNDV